MRNLLQITGLVIATAFGFSWAHVVHAAATRTGSSGNELAEMCTHKNYIAKNQDWYWCVGEVNGVIEGIHVGELYMLGFYLQTDPDLKVKAPPIFCPPDGVTREQAALIVTKYVKSHPQAFDDPNMQVEPNAELIATSLRAAWPCGKGVH